ncbi:MAG: nicotinate (nicotinamide) nucleotide adenylyltransferase [Rhodospirillales bacterium]|nr:nicotinate (nicotinamide) nucleotide adenylyltransferase [Rhodospirillales bacterium]
MARLLTVGGTFNPVHIGHLRLAIETREILGFDRVEWLPCYAPRHKSGTGLLPFSLRLQLLRAAIADQIDDFVNDVECRLPTPSYTYQTLAALAESGDGAERSFVLGATEFAQLHKWHRGREVLSHCDVIVGIRGGEVDLDAFGAAVAAAWTESRAVAAPAGALAAYELIAGRQAILLPLPKLEVSASLVRQRWLERRSLAHLLPPSVIDLLEAHHDLAAQAWAAPRPCPEIP